MIALEKFLELIEIAGTPLKDHQAYRMDGTSPQSDMRKEVGLGTCNCCDYFMLGKDNASILIEETRLIDQIRDLRSEYRYLNVTDQKEFINKYIQKENRLKAYGSMLVLCRLVAIYNDEKDLLRTRKYKFWLVVSGMYSTKDARFFRNLRVSLSNDLKSVLSGKIVDDVEIIPSSVFAAKLSQHAPTP